jgi:energy-coupling factor transporter ATPase
MPEPGGDRVGDYVAEIRDLAHTYLPGTPVSTVALRGAHLQVARGEIHALLGRSGAGKSTLAQFLNGLLRPTHRGQVVVLGQDMAEERVDIPALRRRVGLVFQHPHHQLFERYVGDDVAYGPRQLGLTGEALRERVRWAMDVVGLDFDRFVDRQTFSLSGGEMRRAALAGVIAMQPEVLVLDEATTGLDPRGRADVHALLRRLRDEQGITVVLVSNDMAEVAEIAQRVTILDAGRTVLGGKVRDVLTRDEELIAYGLLPPPVWEIAQQLKRQGIPVQGWPLVVAELEEALWNALMP